MNLSELEKKRNKLLRKREELKRKIEKLKTELKVLAKLQERNHISIAEEKEETMPFILPFAILALLIVLMIGRDKG